MAVDLTGDWTGSDNGRYYIRQINHSVWWYGENGYYTAGWSNVAHGYIYNDYYIELDWADVPKGSVMGFGHLSLKVINSNTI